MGEITERQKCVIECLQQNVDMPTKDIRKLTECSERYIQKIRKRYKEYLDSRKKDPDTVWGALDPHEKGKGESMSNAFQGLDEWEIDVLNMANEGGWSVQQIAETFTNVTSIEVRAVLVNHKDLVTGDVLDEDNANVFGIVPVLSESKKESKKGGNGADDDGDFWEVKIDCVNECGKVNPVIPVFLSSIVRRKVKLYMHWAGAREWLCYLLGINHGDMVEVQDIILPDQTTTGVKVDEIKMDEYNSLNVIGVIHSHHNMGAGTEENPGFSGHDEEFINGNHNVSLLVATNGKTGYKMTGHVRVKTPCDAFIRVKAKILELQEANLDEKSLQTEFKDKVFGKPGKGANSTHSQSRYFNQKTNEDQGEDQGYHFTKNPTIHNGRHTG